MLHQSFLHKSVIMSTCKRSICLQTLQKIFYKSVESVQPHNLIPQQVKVNTDKSHLCISGRTFDFHQKKPYLVGFGKAVFGMSLELESLIELEMAFVSVPQGTLAGQTSLKNSKINFIEGAKNNLPDEAAQKGATQIKHLVEKLTKDDLLLVLISGGGSALLPLPVAPITLSEKQNLIMELSRRGADIRELNTVRKRISEVKGGGLARLAYPARVIALILSDVVDDPLDVIASGPTTPNEDRKEEALNVIRKYELETSLPNSIRQVLSRDNDNIISDGGTYEHVSNFIIGNNQIATEAAKQQAHLSGFHQSAILSTSLTGNVHQISRLYADLIHNVTAVMKEPSHISQLKHFLETFQLFWQEGFIEQILSFDFSKTICIIGGGEPTVVVKGNGKGGRNQHLALEVALHLEQMNAEGVAFLSGGTDGMDGPTDAAGAIATLDLMVQSRAKKIQVEDYLEANDSYNFYNLFHGDFILKVGHTGTNVMDIHVLVIQPNTPLSE